MSEHTLSRRKPEIIGERVGILVDDEIIQTGGVDSNIALSTEPGASHRVPPSSKFRDIFGRSVPGCCCPTVTRSLVCPSTSQVAVSVGAGPVIQRPVGSNIEPCHRSSKTPADLHQARTFGKRGVRTDGVENVDGVVLSVHHERRASLESVC